MKQRNELESAPLGIETLAASAYRAWCHVMGVLNPASQGQLPSWDDVPDVYQQAWGQVALTALRFSEDRVEMSPSQAAADLRDVLYDHFHDSDRKPLEDEPPHVQLAWQAVARHLAYLTANGESGDALDELEASWADWARKRAPQPYGEPS